MFDIQAQQTAPANKVRMPFRMMFALFFLATIHFFPLFPNQFGRSQIHINIIAVSMVVIFFLSLQPRWNKCDFLWVVILFAPLQFLLLITWVFGAEGYAGVGDFPSAFRPVMLVLYVLLFLAATSALSNFPLDKLYQKISLFLGMLVVFTVPVAILEVFSAELFSPVSELLYKRGWKTGIEEVATTYYGLNYYSGFSGFTALCMLMPRAFTNKKLVDYALMGMSLIWIFLAQSKVMMIAALAALVLYSTLQRPLLLLLFGAIFLVAFVAILLNAEDVAAVLRSTDLAVARSMARIISAPEDSDTLGARVDQIIQAWQMAMEGNLLVGTGLGRGILMESWIADALYRYGVLGVVWFLFFAGALTLMNIGSMNNLNKLDNSSANYARGLAVWALLLPFTQLSNMMIDTSKLAVISMFIVALSILNHRASKRMQKFDGSRAFPA